jgi:hypothetical protein
MIGNPMILDLAIGLSATTEHVNTNWEVDEESKETEVGTKYGLGH